jgi:dienelactone hydrolase
MPIRVSCPHCDQNYNLRDELAGATVRCKSCGEPFPVQRRTSKATEEEEFEVVEESDPPPTRSKPTRRKSTSRKKGSSGGGNVLKWVLGGLAAFAFVVILACGGLIFIGHRAARNLENVVNEQAKAARAEVPPAGGPSELFPIDQYPLPDFPELGPGQPIEGTGVTVQTLTIQPAPDKLTQPGFQTQMRIYLPEGPHAPGTLPLVLVAPAGTPLFVGNRLDDPNYHDETLPYAKAGAVVIMYSLDGEADLEHSTDTQLGLAYQRFRNAGAGTVNTRVALEFALQRIPGVDPKKIVVAGHSSAGALSMLYAAHDPRLAAGIAYCACTDVPARMGDFVAQVQGRNFFDGIGEFFQKSSPNTHVAKVQCPIFVFHSFDDTNCPYSESQKFVAQLQAAGKDVILSEPPAYGDHYQPMIDEGIPRAIAWLRSRGILAPQ